MPSALGGRPPLAAPEQVNLIPGPKDVEKWAGIASDFAREGTGWEKAQNQGYDCKGLYCKSKSHPLNFLPNPV